VKSTLTGTRAVLVPYAPTTHRCEACGEPIVGKKGRRPAIVCHIADLDGIIRTTLWYHAPDATHDCYDNRYGPVIDRGQLPAKSRTRWSR
jgi:hypothetical protein